MGEVTTDLKDDGVFAQVRSGVVRSGCGIRGFGKVPGVAVALLGIPPELSFSRLEVM